MHWLSRIVSWLICILVLVAGIALSVVLWHAYYKMHHKSEQEVQFSYLDQFVRNEQAVLVLAILATIAVVNISILKRKHKKFLSIKYP